MSDTIIAGVAPGGLKEVYEVKILICYLFNVVKTPLSKEHLLEIFTIDGTVDYFTFSTAFREMEVSGHFVITKPQEGDLYALSDLGIETANNLKQALPVSLRDRIVKIAMATLAKMKNDNTILTSITPHQEGFHVNCTLRDKELEFLALSFFAPDRTQAELIEKRLYARSPEIYQSIMKTLLEE